jgi:predicted RNA-binding Zn ribbon-like protein
VALLQAFLNTFFDLGDDWGADLLDSPGRLGSWLEDRRLVEHGARFTNADVARAITVREGLRDLIASQGEIDEARLNDAFSGASLELRVTERGARLTPTGARPLDRALGTLLAIALTAMLDGTWSRLKSCPGHHCGWVFYDRSRNNSGRWCSMTVCGGREKSRAHYHRQRVRGD